MLLAVRIQPAVVSSFSERDCHQFKQHRRRLWFQALKREDWTDAARTSAISVQKPFPMSLYSIF